MRGEPEAVYRMSETRTVTDLEGNDVTGCRWCEAIQARDWQTIEHLSDFGEKCTCPEQFEEPEG
jgi:hypothetical protein